jgi:hypothetical protein
MGRPELEELLRPSLEQGEVLRPPYSVRAGFFVAFFGGVFGAVAFGALNAVRTRRTMRDGVVLAILAASGAVFAVWSGYAVAARAVPAWLAQVAGERDSLRLLGRGLALASYGVVYLMQREIHETAAFRGQTPPSAWGPGILLVLVGISTQFVLAMLGGTLGQP